MSVDTSELATYRRLIGEKYAEIDQLLADLPAAALLWRPFETSPWRGPCSSLGLIIAHAISSTVYLVRQAEYAAGKREWGAVDGDEGSDEFGPANHDPAYLQARSRYTYQLIDQMLADFTPEELNRSRPHPKRSDRVLTARYPIQHAIEHLSQHIGHAQLTRQLWALKAG
jgi:hypothetical protein